MSLVYNGKVVASNTPHVRYTPIKLVGGQWTGDRQTVPAPGVVAGNTDQLLTISTSDEVGTNNIIDFGLTLVGNDTDSVTFACKTVPDQDIDLTLVIIPMKKSV